MPRSIEREWGEVGVNVRAEPFCVSPRKWSGGDTMTTNGTVENSALALGILTALAVTALLPPPGRPSASGRGKHKKT